MPVRHFEIVQEFALSREEIWDVLANTDRLNRHIGLPPVAYGTVQNDDDGLFRPARARFFGLPTKWHEYPFSWEKEGRYSVVRTYENGPMARFEGGVELEDAQNGRTKVTFFADIVARGAWGRALVPLIARDSLRQTAAFCKRAFAPDACARPLLLPLKKGSLSPELLELSLRELSKRSLSSEVVAALGTHLATADDPEVLSLRPFAWADANGLPRDEALLVCLHAVKIGLLNLKWAMMCPNCRVAKNEAISLSAVSTQVHCDLCGVNYDLNFDRYVELKFAVHPAIRRASENVYCLAGPFAAPHILIQARLAPGERHFFEKFPDTGSLRLRIIQKNQTVAIESGAAALEELVWNERWSVPAVRGAVLIHNASSEPIVVVLERVDWDDQAVTAARVTALQGFRDLFSSEVLRAGREIAIENTTLFFSDLSNSTALYERIGDAPAYARVGQHFEFLQKQIAAHNGAVVKTIGDAVMAVFATPADAMRAALQIQNQFQHTREEISENREVELKIGLHFGPTLAITSNNTLDYFGRTVNIAARTVHFCEGGEIVLSGVLCRRPEIQELISKSNANSLPFHAKLRGLDQEMEMVRLCLCEGKESY